MSAAHRKLRWACLALLVAFHGARAEVIYETTSAYHRIVVTDYQGMRTLFFDDAMESRMSLQDPLKGHFEYTEFFHLPWLWNERITNVLMVGLGGASVPRAFQRFHPQVTFEAVELDAKVVRVARDYFFLRESPTLKVTVADGRQHLRRSRQKFDLIVMDAYTANRYGSYLPYSLVTREFFALAFDRLSENGVLAYNVISPVRPRRKQDIVAAIHQTLNVVFPQVYQFHAATSQNVVLLATRSARAQTAETLQQKADDLVQRRVITVPGFKGHLRALRPTPGYASDQSLILSDDYAPLNGLLNAD